MDRRDFLGLLGVGALSTIRVSAATTGICTVLDFDGKPLSPVDLSSFQICDLIQRPNPVRPSLSRGLVAFQPPSSGRFRISLLLRVPGFGRTFLFADNKGRGYTEEFFSTGNRLFLTLAFAEDRYATVLRLVTELAQSGFDIPVRTQQRIEQAAVHLARAQQASDPPNAARWAGISLTDSMYAGEELVYTRAAQTIARPNGYRGRRPGFRFGCTTMADLLYGRRRYAELWGDVGFNYASLPFYMNVFESVQGSPNYRAIDESLEWLDPLGASPKGTALVWFHPQYGVPEYFYGKSFEEVKALALGYVRQSVQRYRGVIEVWDVASEINSMNVLHLDEGQLLDITAAACVATREEDPAATRNVNICCPWGEFMTREVGVGQKAPFDFVKSMVDAEVEFDVIGLQNYFYARDLLEMERQLETFAGFGKPVHISETEVPAEGRADLSWHGREWSETLQADWLQAAYTLWFSKPYITAITLWDLVDSPYGPYSGIVGPDLVPREAYYRLQSLLQMWNG